MSIETTNTPIGPAERLAVMAEFFLAQMPAELRAESQTLAELDDGSGLGVRVHCDEPRDLFHLTWMGRWIGSVDGSFVRGECAA